MILIEIPKDASHTQSIAVMNAISIDFLRVQITNIINSFARNYLYPIAEKNP